MFKHKKVKRALKGYMSLEASFIMPWTIFLFVFLIYSSFYLYDKCVLFQDAYTLCLRGSVQKEEGGAIKYVNEHMTEKFGNKYFGVGRITGRAEQSVQEIKVIGECKLKIPFDNFLTMAKRSGWEIQVETRAQMINPTKIIRKCRIAENFFYNAGG